MNKFQKEIIAKCEPYKEGTLFDELYVIPANKYTGFCYYAKSKCQYQRILLVCYAYKDNKWYVSSSDYQCDLLSIVQLGDVPIRFDVPLHTNTLRAFCSGYMFYFYEELSEMKLMLRKKENAYK